MHICEKNLLSLRPATPEDEVFLHGLYASTREDVRSWNSGEEDVKEFLLMQYSMQDLYFRAHYPEAALSIVQNGGEDTGRIYVDRSAKEIRLLDITLFPRYRNRGIGSMLLGEIIRESEDKRIPARLMVERFSRARTLYERMGFSIIEDTGTHFQMERDSRRNQ